MNGHTEDPLSPGQAGGLSPAARLQLQHQQYLASQQASPKQQLNTHNQHDPAEPPLPSPPSHTDTSAWRDQQHFSLSPPALPKSLSLNLRPGLLSHGPGGGARRVSTGNQPHLSLRMNTQSQGPHNPTSPSLQTDAGGGLSPTGAAASQHAQHAHAPAQAGNASTSTSSRSTTADTQHAQHAQHALHAGLLAASRPSSSGTNTSSASRSLHAGAASTHVTSPALSPRLEQDGAAGAHPHDPTAPRLLSPTYSARHLAHLQHKSTPPRSPHHAHAHHAHAPSLSHSSSSPSSSARATAAAAAVASGATFGGGGGAGGVASTERVDGRSSTPTRQGTGTAAAAVAAALDAAAPPPAQQPQPQQLQPQQQQQQQQQQPRQQRGSHTGPASGLPSRLPAPLPNMSLSTGSSSAVLQAAMVSQPQGSQGAAEDRRELLRLYKAAKEAKMQASRPQAPAAEQRQSGSDASSLGLPSAGSSLAGSRSGSMTSRPGRPPPIPLHGRLQGGGSLGTGGRSGMPRPVAAPQLSQAEMGKAMAAPLPPDTESSWEGMAEAHAQWQHSGVPPSRRSTSTTHRTSDDPIAATEALLGAGSASTRSSMSATTSRSSGMFPGPPPVSARGKEKKGSPPQKEGGRQGSFTSGAAPTLGGLGLGNAPTTTHRSAGNPGVGLLAMRGAERVTTGGGGSGTGGVQYGGIGSVVVLNGGGLLTHAASQELRTEMRQLRLQELQWRFVNAKVAASLAARQQKSERALAACALAITDLQSRAAVLSAQHARSELVDKAEHASSVLRGPLDAWQEVEEAQQAALQPTMRALQDSLTNVPLLGGAHCGPRNQMDLGRLQDVMDRGMFALQVMASALEPLLAAAASSHSYTALGSSRASRGGRQSEARPGSSIGTAKGEGDANKAEESDKQPQLLPTATQLLGLAAAVQQEVALLKEVMTSLRRLNDKQSLVSSYQAQLLHMQRAGMIIEG